MKNISKHITYAEATKSQKAIRFGEPNFPTTHQLEKMVTLAEEVFEPLREAMGNKPIYVSSFFRTKRVNELVGGATNSQHTKGEAMDIDADVFGGMKNSEIFQYILENLDFDQLIWEYGDEKEPAWVHVSYKTPETNRNQVLKY